jgi:hypothetical protein
MRLMAAPARGQVRTAQPGRAAAAEVADAAVAPVRTAARRVISLVPPIESDGPRVRLGVAYGVAATVLLVVGGIPLALGAGAFGAVAATQTARSWGALRPVRYLAFGGGLLIPIAATAGPLGAAAAAVAVLVAAVVLAGPRSTDLSLIARVALIPIVCGLAAGAPVALRGEGLAGVGVLAAGVLLYDATVFVMGADAKWRWEGVIPGLVAVVAVTLFAAAVLVPPFRGAAPWVLGGLALVALPAGAIAGSLLRGPEPRPVPGLLRIDSLLVLGPLWLLLAPFLLG